MQRLTYDPMIPPDPEEWLALDETERAARVYDYHRRARIKVPNARLHALFHALVETQAAMGDETPVRRTLERLQREGLDRHDAVHAVGSVLAEQIHDMMATEPSPAAPDPNPAYFAAVERLDAQRWLRGEE